MMRVWPAVWILALLGAPLGAQEEAAEETPVQETVAEDDRTSFTIKLDDKRGGGRLHRRNREAGQRQRPWACLWKTQPTCLLLTGLGTVTSRSRVRDAAVAEHGATEHAARQGDGGGLRGGGRVPTAPTEEDDDEW